jgi:outer membrane protein assembly factor BamD (BamD/ComL family)
LGPNRARAEELFAQAKADYDRAVDADESERVQLFRAVAKDLEKAGEKWPNSELEEKSFFLAGEAYFFGQQYPKAEAMFGELIKKYPNTHFIDKIDARRFDIGRYWIETAKKNGAWGLAPNVTRRDQPVFDMFNHGVRVLDRIRLDDPTGRLADDATMAAGMAHYEKGNYARADELFNDLRHSFPSSEHQFHAHLYGLKAKTMIYQGASYDGTPLEQVAELVQQIQRMFPTESQEHREFLADVSRDVRLNLALRDFERAEYFDRRKQFGAARQYYVRVRDQYSDTSLAQKSADRLAQLGDAPNRPPQYLPWLVELMPSSKQPKPLVARGPGTEQR